MIQWMLAIWSLVPLPFLNPAWTCGSSWFTYCWSLENFEHYFTSVWDECNCAVVWAFFGIAFLWDWNENWPFQSCGHCRVFQICWHIECSTLQGVHTGKESACSAGDTGDVGSVTRSGRSPGRRKWPLDREAWWATVQGSKRGRRDGAIKHNKN